MMLATLAENVKTDVSELILALGTSPAYDRLQLPWNAAQWDVFAAYLLPMNLVPGQTLMEQGETDRTIYLVETGTLSVHYEDAKGRVRLAMVGPGSVVGEGAFFSHLQRSATVQAASPAKLWALTALRYAELCNRQPSIALDLCQNLGAVMARRLVNRPKRTAIT
jgi:CRP/FNR family transcriptional regulator, cyclic AMP receptor protein